MRAPTIFDVGMNNGDDTAFYLCKGFSVVAVEANPRLCDQARARFAGEITTGRLRIVNAALWERAGQSVFYINLANDHLSSMERSWASRGDAELEELPIECVTLPDLFAEHGVPRHLKIDIEGADGIVIDQLRNMESIPEYVSVEDCRFGLAYVWSLSAVGYRVFNMLDQSMIPGMVDQETGHQFAAGSSGPLGCDLPGPWRDRNAFEDHYHATVRDVDGKRIASPDRWFDIHAWTGRR